MGTRIPQRKLLSIALTACFLISVNQVYAQSTAATLRGHVENADTNAVITVTNTATGLSRSIQVSDDGDYVVFGLPPGSYRVELVNGNASQDKNVILAVGQIAVLNLNTPLQGDALDKGKTLNTIEVVASAQELVEARTSENSMYISNAQIQRLPQATRNFLEVADIVPGVQFIRDGGGNTKIQSGATSAAGVNVYIDGIGQKDYVLTGGVSGQDSSRGNPFPQSAIGEYKVITSNYNAEYDQLSSAAVVASTKSGGNEFEGSLFWDTTSEKWRSESPLEEKAGKRDNFSETEWGVSFGGPIVKDRAHFFIAYENKEYVTPATVTLGSIYADRINELPQELQALVHTYDSPFKENLYFGKLDWLIGDNNYFELTGKYRDEEGVGDLGGITPYEHASYSGQNEKRLSLRWQYSGTMFLNDLTLSYEDTYWTQDPITKGSGYLLTYAPLNNSNTGATEESGILNLGAGASYQNKGQSGWSIQDDLTFDMLEWNGDHTIKLGVKYKDLRLDSTQINPANPQYYYNVLTGFDTPYRVMWGDVINGSVVSNNQQYGVYIQDDWEVNEHLMLNLGVRYDYEITPSFLDFVTPTPIVNALTNWKNLDNADYKIADYISTGDNRKAFSRAVQPRFGFSYDFLGDQKHVLYGGAGRAYDRNVFDYMALEQIRNLFSSYNYYFSSSDNPYCLGSPCVAWDDIYATQTGLDSLATNFGGAGGREIYLIDNNVRVPYSDQFSLGMRNSLHFWSTDWLTDVSLSYIGSKDGLVFLRGNRREDGSFFAPGTTFGAPGNSPDGYSSILLGTNGLRSRNNQLAIKVEKPYSVDSGWGMTLAYTFSDAKENRQFGEHYAFDYPTIDGYGWHQATSIPKNRLVVTGTYDLPWWDISLSGKLSLASQTPVYSLNCLEGYDQCFFDQFTPDNTFGYKDLSLAINKEIRMGEKIRMNVRADIMNVFNWVNYSSYITGTGVYADLNTAYGRPTGDLALPMRTFKLTFGMSW